MEVILEPESWGNLPSSLRKNPQDGPGHLYSVTAEGEEMKPISVLPVRGSIVRHAHDSPQTEYSGSEKFCPFALSREFGFND
jgi:hypothetical protein